MAQVSVADGLDDVLTFNEQQQRIREVLDRHPAKIATAFAATCAHRLINSAKPDSEYARLVELAVDSINHLEEVVLHDMPLRTDLIESLEAAIPDEDDEPSLEAGVVDDALASTCYALMSVASEPVVNACYAAARAFDTVFRVAGHRLNSPVLSDEAEKWILERDIVQRELQRQARDLKRVEEAGPDIDGLIRSFLTTARRESIWDEGAGGPSPSN